MLGARVLFRKAISPDGKNLLENPLAAVRLKEAEVQFQALWIEPTPVVSIPDAAEAVKGPLALEGVVRLTFGVGKKELRLEKVFADGKKTARPQRSC